MTPTIIFFGITSLLADIAGEMIFPILPLFFTIELGLSAALFGIIEGFAEGFANLIQVWFGWISDKLKKRKVFIIAGYLTAALGKFFLVLAHSWPLLIFARMLDRSGKGIRTTPRDALLAESIGSEKQGIAFGFHRTMDNAGAVIGNAIVIILVGLHYDLRTIIWLSLIPAILAVLFIFPVREPKLDHVAPSKKISMPTWADFTTDRKKFGKEFWRFIFISILFYLGKISYAFMLLRIAHFGVPTEQIPFYYLVFNVVQTAFSLPVGKFADTFGKAILVFIGFSLFALTSLGFIFGGGTVFLLGLFVLYGLSFAFIEVAFRALLIELSPPELKATGLGVFFTVTGLTVMLGGLIAGALWQYGNGLYAFSYSAVSTGLAALLFFIFFRVRIIGACHRLYLGLARPSQRD